MINMGIWNISTEKSVNCQVTPIKKLRKLPVDKIGHPLDYVSPSWYENKVYRFDEPVSWDQFDKRRRKMQKVAGISGT